MTLTTEVARILHRRQMCTNEVAALLPSCTKGQVRSALQGAMECGLIVRVRPGSKKGMPAVWEGVLLEVQRKPPPKKDRLPRVASVWELGSGPSVTAWPPAGEGRMVAPLGAWDAA